MKLATRCKKQGSLRRKRNPTDPKGMTVAVRRSLRKKKARSSGRFGAEHALEARADELHPNNLLPVGQYFADMHDAPLSLKVCFVAPRGRGVQRNADLQVRADSYVEPRSKCGPAAAQILAGGIFLEGETMRVAAAHA